MRLIGFGLLVLIVCAAIALSFEVVRERLRIPRGISSSLPLAVGAGLLILVMGIRDCAPDPRPIAPVQVDTADAAAYRQALAETREQLETVRGERDGLRGRVATLQARLRGIEERTPKHVTVYDTIIQLAEITPALQSSIGRRGRLTILAAVPTAGGHRPEAREGIDVRDCDDGLTIVGADVICDRAMLGHLSVYLSAGASAPLASVHERPQVSGHLSVGVQWRPSFRSQWQVGLAARVDGRLEVEVRRGLRIW